MNEERNSRALRIALLRGDDHHNVYLDRLLRGRFDVEVTVVEPGLAQRRALRRRGRWKDAIAAEYHLFRRTVLGLNRYRRAAFAEMPGGGIDAPPSLVVASINDAAVHAALTAAQADLCVITCTTILSRDTIAAAGCTVLNIHGGHLPDYRGCHCFFFALYAGEFDKIGSTLHFVDAGIDTGDILEVVRPAIHRDDNAERLYCRAERLAAHRLYHWLERLEAGEELPRTPQPYRGRLCLRRSRGPHHDVIFAARRAAGLLRLPEVATYERWQPR